MSRLREGLILDIDLRYLRDALHDPATGLTYEALTGKNKQSVPDCERLIGPGVISFLERKGHIGGASIIRRIHNWHKAFDGRGLTEEQRSTYCRDMKEWLLSDWMPWYSSQPNFSTIDVNRWALDFLSFVEEPLMILEEIRMSGFPESLEKKKKILKPFITCM